MSNFRLLGWAIYPTPAVDNQNNAFDWMVKSALDKGILLKVLFAENFSISVVEGRTILYYHGEECALPHFVLMRHYDYELSQFLEKSGVRVVNNGQSMRLSQNKFLTHVALAHHGLPTPKTLFRVDNYSVCVHELGSPFILKAIRGSKGMEVFLVHTSEEFNQLKNRYEFITQQYIASSYGRDIRIWVIGDRAVASVLRRSTTSFKSNIALGATAEHFSVTPEIEHLAVGSCRALGLELAGVDILFDGEGYTICEVNGNAGFRAFSLSGDQVDIPALIFDYLRKELHSQPCSYCDFVALNQQH